MQKPLTCFKKILAFIRYECLNINETLTNDVVSFEQPGPGVNVSHAVSSFPLHSIDIFYYTKQTTAQTNKISTSHFNSLERKRE